MANPTGINQYTKSSSKTHGIKKPVTRKDFIYGSKRNPASVTRKSPSGFDYNNRPSTQLARSRVIKRVKAK